MTDNKGKDVDMQAARLKAIASAPYLATAIWNMTPVKMEGLKSGDRGGMGVDKYWRLYYDPAVFEVWTMEEVSEVIKHEVWHLLRNHAGRAKAMGMSDEDFSADSLNMHKMWNYAADCEINDDLRDEGGPLPEGCIYPDSPFNFPCGLTAEEYFDLIQQGVNDGSIKTSPMPSANPFGNDGSGATGQAGKWEAGADGSGGEGDGKDANGNPIPSGVPQGEGELLRKQVAQEIGKHAGTAPAFAQRWAKNQLNPQVDWRRLLAAQIRGAIMDQSGMIDYTYSRPSRRQGSPSFRRLVLPSLRGPKPVVQVAIDTSGSMSEKDLEIALGEVKGILDATQAEVTVFAVDTHVSKKQKVYDPKQIKLIGGGGTDMGRGLEAMAEDRAPIAIVLTDGYTPWPLTKPRGLGKVIIAIVRSRRWGSPPDAPDYATVVETWNEGDR